MWAEAIHLYQEKEPLYLSVEETSEALEEQIEAMETDDRQGMVEVYLNTPLPENWDIMSVYERRNYLNGDDFGISDDTETYLRDIVCNMEIWVECFGKDGSSMKSADSFAIAAIIKKVKGWTKPEEKDNTRKQFPIYGRQRFYKRTSDPAENP